LEYQLGISIAPVGDVGGHDDQLSLGRVLEAQVRVLLGDGEQPIVISAQTLGPAQAKGEGQCPAVYLRRFSRARHGWSGVCDLRHLLLLYPELNTEPGMMPRGGRV